MAPCVPNDCGFVGGSKSITFESKNKQNRSCLLMFWLALYMESFKGGGASNGCQVLFYFFICQNLMSYPVH